jgi:hypothetical protein
MYIYIYMDLVKANICNHHKMDVGETMGGVDWIGLAQDDKWRDPVNEVMSLRVP